MSDLIIGEPDVIRKEDNILWLRAEIERLTAEDAIKGHTIERLTEVRDAYSERIATLEPENKQLHIVCNHVNAEEKEERIAMLEADATCWVHGNNKEGTTGGMYLKANCPDCNKRIAKIEGVLEKLNVLLDSVKPDRQGTRVIGVTYLKKFIAALQGKDDCEHVWSSTIRPLSNKTDRCTLCGEPRASLQEVNDE